MKKIKKMLGVTLACMVIVSAVSCGDDNTGRRQQNETINTEQTQLYIYNYNAGFGGDWIKTIGKSFSEKYAEYSFEEGKKGVQVILDNEDAPPKVETVANSRDSIFFTENTNYYDFIGQGAMRDITSLVNEHIADGDASIVDKMNSYGSWGDFYKTSENKYYAIPFHEGMNGMIYDIDLFESKSLYFSKAYDDGATGVARWAGATGERSKGPDGKYGTFDDGMPATYADFYVLLQRMKDRGVIPMHYAGKVIDYTTKAFTHFWATNEGKEQMMLNFTFNGEANDIATISGGEVSLSSETINADNAWKLQQQYGKYQTLQFIKNITTDLSNFHTLSNSGSETHLSAQSTYLYSGMNNEPIAILFDGTWWQREANAIFDAMASTDASYSKANRRFGLMPIPHATDANVGNKQVYIGGLGSMVFMNPDAKGGHLAAAEAFMKFIHTEESLKTFTKETGSTRPFVYNFDNEELIKLPSFTQSVWNIHKNEIIINSRSNALLHINNFDTLNIDYTAFDASIGGVNYKAPISALKTISVEDYFNGMLNYRKNNWSKLVR